MSVEQIILLAYPKAERCSVLGHTKDFNKTLFYEEDDDRCYALIVNRCKRCDMPVGDDSYATPEEEERLLNETRN